ncbi:DUF3761 domain-containing protein [Mycobacterium stomatepiae]|uniref:DUF3761 domain-containing protein n=1 Tax=Mycobacterium stomatepiae TaxID=470076 RepID=UPI0013D6F290|nr:DUF3761 domain-containing protein [Mycobacterium stomatepiae]MCV7166206.1 DUF3761 domain-containing protein [Mycobacterium stomatepiae]
MSCPGILASIAAAVAIYMTPSITAEPLSPTNDQTLDAIANSQARYLECPTGTYQGTSGNCVPSPDSSCSVATAVCKDGSCSHSEHRSGTCSSHGGVGQWCPCNVASEQSVVVSGPGDGEEYEAR